MEHCASKFIGLESYVAAKLYSSYDSHNNFAQMSRAGKWMRLSAFMVVIATLWWLWAYVLRLYLLRRYYEKQSIRFVKNCVPVLGTEIQVSELHGKNQSHDWLYTDNPTDLFGTVRGFSVQLYGTSAELCEELIAKTGKHVDRDTPALFSFGRLSPSALTFLPTNKWRSRERKANLIRGMKDNKRLYDIVARQAKESLASFKIKNGSGAIIDIRQLLNHWTRQSAGEYVWGRKNSSRYVEALDPNGNLETLPFMTALNQTFTELRFFAGRFWNRVWFRLAVIPITKESRRLDHNIKHLRRATESMMTTPEPGSVAASVQEANLALGVPLKLTRDDLTAGTIAGLDTIKAAVMGTLFHLLEPQNLSWRREILAEITALDGQPGDANVKLSHAPKLNAFILEALRYEPPGSLINNAAVKDFSLSSVSVPGREYHIKAGTRIVSCIHALHQNETTWKNKVSGAAAGRMSPLKDFDPNRFLHHANDIVGSYCFMPFGKGPRRCPGQEAGVMMVKVFVANFLTSCWNCRMEMPRNQGVEMSWFNIHSKATFDIHCDDEPGEGEEKGPLVAVG